MRHIPTRLLATLAMAAAVALPTATVSADGGSQPLPAPPGQVIWPFVEHWSVPQLGSEPVRGTGCGGSVDLPEQIPDGLWAGQIDGINGQDIYTSTAIAFDVWCIYYGESAQAAINNGANVILNDLGYLIVNNNERDRTVNLANGFIHRYAVATVDGRCIDPGPAAVAIVDANGRPFFYDAQTWLYIQNGAAVWAFTGCNPVG